MNIVTSLTTYNLQKAFLKSIGVHFLTRQIENPRIFAKFSSAHFKMEYQQRRFLFQEEDWQKKFEGEKEKYLEMPLHEKRKVYKCRKCVTLQDIPTWHQFFTKNEEKFSKSFRRKKLQVQADPNESLNSKISMWRGDITSLEADCIVNAANSSLLGGGGVDGAIHSAAGRYLLAECSTLNGCETGDAKITGGYKLPAKYVIHTVGPIGESAEALMSCYETSLELMLRYKLRTVAFPCISTGIYGYPSSRACPVAIKTIRSWLEKDNNADMIDRIVFCLFLPKDVDIYQDVLQEYFPIHPDVLQECIPVHSNNGVKDKEDKDHQSSHKQENKAGKGDKNKMSSGTMNNDSQNMEVDSKSKPLTRAELMDTDESSKVNPKEQSQSTKKKPLECDSGMKIDGNSLPTATVKKDGHKAKEPEQKPVTRSTLKASSDANTEPKPKRKPPADTSVTKL